MKDLLDIIFSANKNSEKLQELEVIKGDADGRDISAALRGELEKIAAGVSLLIEENTVHKKEIQQLKAQIAGEKGFDVRDNVYYTPDGDGPFCPFCYERRRKKIRLRRVDSEDGSVVRHICRVCEGSFSE